ncbi:AAA family ATPase [Actinophytocola oryzae]|uniref:AAA domain-containing protein n=1 Tax=Actinophytocola oryzae TaxID=502181 RepID=A0A4R7VYQ3_9PSEU|nr:AAA family ATPase [Actinophytocola oryzae]TDV55172.1 AAA domain-containing protein [Actinophytocola oryzae]
MSLIWLNGPFGGGKTQTAYELHRRLAGSVVCDPEHAGFGLRRMLPPGLRADFQDLTSWRTGVVEVLDLTLRSYEGAVIAPMTVTEPKYFEETVGRLRDLGHEVHHFALLARRETVLKRLKERDLVHTLKSAVGLGPNDGGETWARRQLDTCLNRLRDKQFASHVWTDDLTVPEVADQVAAEAGLSLTENSDSRLTGQVRRAWTGIKHIRLD